MPPDESLPPLDRPPLAHPGKAIALTTGADDWSSIAAPAHGIRALQFADGPHGLRLQNDANPDHPGSGPSLPATCFPPAATLASSRDAGLIADVVATRGREARAHGEAVCDVRTGAVSPGGRLAETLPQELRGWAKLRLTAGESRAVEIPVRRDRLMHRHVPSQGRVHRGGAATVCSGASPRDLRLAAQVDLHPHHRTGRKKAA